MQLSCDCSYKPALRKSEQPLSKDHMFLTCYKKGVTFSSGYTSQCRMESRSGFLYTQVTGRKIPSLWRDKGDV